MFIANASQQTVRFNFRIPEQHRINVLTIPSGHQVDVGETWNESQRDAVVRQLRFYGAREASERQMRHGECGGLTYRVDKPLSETLIHDANDMVVNAQQDRAKSELTRTALGVDASLRDPKTRQRRARRTTLSVTQDLSPFDAGAKRQVDYGVTVDPDGHDIPSVE